ncbi:4-coumarate-coa ligase, partial [Globisporangium splendens]
MLTRALFARSARRALLLQQTQRSLSAAASEKIIFHSPHEKLEIPNATIFDIAQQQAKVNGARNAFIDGVTHQKLTFEELYEGAKRLAVALAEDGVRKGDATHIIAHKDLKDVAVEAAEMIGIPKKYVYTMGVDPASKLKSVNELAKREFGSFEFEKIDPESNVLLPFSSGTTGIPKGVALSARNMISNAVQVDHVEEFGDHSLGLLPFFHIYGMMLAHLTIYNGTAKVVLPRFEPETFLNAMQTYKIRAAHVAPPVALFLAHHPLVDKYDLSATEFLVSGGAPMGKEVEGLVKKRLGVAVKQAYGMTEASPAVNYTEDANHKAGGVGRLLPNTELRVRCTSTGVDLPVGERGELLYRGPQVMIGYLNNPEANNGVFTEDRFLCTGDIGYIDEDGCVFVVDRVKELIKYKGHQVAPAELEDILNHHPGISDACCVRGRDADGEELPKAYVVRKDSGVTEDDVMEFVASRVAPFKKVRQVEFIDAIPKSPTGKILRRQLQEVENNKHRA